MSAENPTPRVPPARPIRICSETGLALVPYPTKGTYRVFKETYGALKGRPRTSENPRDWNRFDLPGQATLYSSTIRRGCYAEVLAPLQPRLDQLTKLAADTFDDINPGDDPIFEEWCERGHMAPGNIARIWHSERALAQINVTTAGWYVDIEDPVSLHVLRRQFAGLLLKQGIEDMDVSVIRGHNRIVTCAIAEWVAALYLEDGSVPLGIRYNSRHGTDWECWATFPETKTAAVHATGLDVLNDPDLKHIADLFELRFH